MTIGSIWSPGSAVPWVRVYEALVANIVRQLLHECELGTGRCRRTENPKTEMEINDPSFLSFAEDARREFLLSLEAFVVQYVKEKQPIRSESRTVTLLLPAKAPLVTCIKICLTCLPPVFDMLIPNAANWHEVRG